eukprot:2377843-Rhodomonas_salina.5
MSGAAVHPCGSFRRTCYGMPGTEFGYTVTVCATEFLVITVVLGIAGTDIGYAVTRHRAVTHYGPST